MKRMKKGDPLAEAAHGAPDQPRLHHALRPRPASHG